MFQRTEWNLHIFERFGWVFFLQSGQELLSDAIVQPAKTPKPVAALTTQDQDPIYPNVIIWPYYELQAILEYDICMRIQVYQPCNF